MSIVVLDLADTVDASNVDTAPWHYNLCDVVDLACVLLVGMSLPALADVVNVSDAVTYQRYVLLSDTVNASEAYTYRVQTNQLLVDQAIVSGAQPQFGTATLDVPGAVNVSDASTNASSVTVADVVQAVEAFTTSAHGVVNLADSVNSSENKADGHVDNNANIVDVSDASLATRFALIDLADSTQASNALGSSGFVAPGNYIDVVDASDAFTTYMRTASDFSDVLTFRDVVLFTNPSAQAVVMNTETTAGSTFANFDFNSIAALGDYIVMAGPEGLYIMSGNTDAGAYISALMKTGFLELGTQQHKHVPEVLLGLNAGTGVTLTAETYGPTPFSGSYPAQSRSAKAPMATRVVLPRGLVSRYWRFTVSNAAGSDFDISSVQVSVAPSTRSV